MPYNSEWEPNELFLEHNAVRIFYVYKHDESNEVRTYSFGTASDTSDEYDDTNFYVRSLPNWVPPIHLPLEQPALVTPKEKISYMDAVLDSVKQDQEYIRTIIIAAIDAGHLKDYIDAAENRPKYVAADFPASPKMVELDGYSGLELESLLTNIHKTTLSRINRLYEAITSGAKIVLGLGAEAVNYSDGAEYTITGIQIQSDGEKKEAMMILQDEEDGPSGLEEYLAGMETDVVISILMVIENIHKSCHLHRE